MGAGNVKAAFVACRGLGDQPLRLLAYMAVVTRDGDSPPRFYDGPDGMAVALGEVMPGEVEAAGSPEARRRRESALRKVRRALAVLVEAGLVACVERPAPGRRAVYALHLRPATADSQCPPSDAVSEDTDRPVSEPATADTGCPSNGGQSVSAVGSADGGHPPSAEGTDGGQSVSATADTHRPPKEFDLKNKIKTCAPAGTRDPDPDPIAAAVVAQHGWPREHADRVVAGILAAAPSTPRAPARYVLALIDRDPQRYRPTATPPAFTGLLAGPAPCVLCREDRCEADELAHDPRCAACAEAGIPAPDPGRGRADARAAAAAARGASRRAS